MTKKDEIVVHYHNDVFFKYALSKEDKDSAYLRNTIIERVTGIRPKQSIVRNPFVPSKYIGEKEPILDVHLTDENGYEYDIEMQTSKHGDLEYNRFAYHCCKLLTNQLPKGGDYLSLKPVYQIIFMEDRIPNNHQLISRFLMLEHKTHEKETKQPLENRIYVHLPMINEIVKQKGIQNMSDFEQLCYLFENDEDDVIIKSKERLVKVTMEKYKDMQEDGELFSLAERQAFAEYRYQHGMEYSFKKGEETGIQLGVQKGKKEKAVELTLKLIQIKYHIEAAEWLKSLTQEQLDIVAAMILECETFDDLKAKTENTTA